MYSVAARPSSRRAAPAKKRIWSTIGGISSDIVSANGLPGVLAFRPHQLLGAGLDGIGDPDQGQAALGGRRTFPRAEGILGREQCPLDVFGRRHRRLRKNLPRARVYERGRLSARRFDLFSVDKVVQFPHWHIPQIRRIENVFGLCMPANRHKHHRGPVPVKASFAPGRWGVR